MRAVCKQFLIFALAYSLASYALMLFYLVFAYRHGDMNGQVVEQFCLAPFSVAVFFAMIYSFGRNPYIHLNGTGRYWMPIVLTTYCAMFLGTYVTLLILMGKRSAALRKTK